jgi:hypothetical protein
MFARLDWFRVHWVRTVLFAVLFLQAALLTWSAKVHSPTWDEPGHLVAGLSHWKYGRFELYSVNPPLVRTIAAAPVYFFMNPEVDWSLYSADPSHRSEVALGRALAQDHGLNIYRMIFVARLAVIPIALIGTLLCFMLARELFDTSIAGLVAAVLWAFTPDVLAYGSVITPDLATAVAGLGCAFALWKFLQAPSMQWAISLGVVTGIAMLCKSTWLILPVVYALVWLITLAIPKIRPAVSAETPRWSKMRQFGMLATCCGIALLLVNAFYGFRGSLDRLGNYSFVSRSLAGEPVPRLQAVDTTRSVHADRVVPLRPVSYSVASSTTSVDGVVIDSCPACAAAAAASAADQAGPYSEVCESCQLQPGLSSSPEAIPDILPGNRFKGTLLGSLPIPLPANYVEGIDIQRRDFESGVYRREWASYLGGQWKQGGWWYFYVTGLVFKTPIALLLLFVLGGAVIAFRSTSQKTLLGLVSVAAISLSLLAVISLNTGLNRYIRYALPVLPLLILFAAGTTSLLHNAKSIAIRRFVGGSIAAAILCIVSISAWNAPHWLSYFNALAGGPSGGQQWFVDSNIDWGQDLPYVQKWIDQHPDAAGQLRVAYFGAISPESVGIQSTLPPAYVKEVANQSYLDQASSGPLPGWYIISKNYVVGHPLPVPTEAGQLQHYRHQPYTYFQKFKPIEQIGYSMFVYHLGYKEVNQVRTDLGLIPIHAQGSSIAHDHPVKPVQPPKDDPSVTQVSSKMF